MVKHCIIWKFKDDIEDKTQHAQAIKIALEGLLGQIDGLLEMHIITEKLPVSSGDLMMDSLFESAAALAAYQQNPLHVKIANDLVRPSMQQRLSFDYECDDV